MNYIVIGARGPALAWAQREQLSTGRQTCIRVANEWFALPHVTRGLDAKSTTFVYVQGAQEILTPANTDTVAVLVALGAQELVIS